MVIGDGVSNVTDICCALDSHPTINTTKASVRDALHNMKNKGAASCNVDDKVGPGYQREWLLTNGGVQAAEAAEKERKKVAKWTKGK